MFNLHEHTVQCSSLQSWFKLRTDRLVDSIDKLKHDIYRNYNGILKGSSNIRYICNIVIREFYTVCLLKLIKDEHITQRNTETPIS